MLDTSRLDAVVGFEPEDEQEVIQRLKFDESLEIPVALTDPEIWKNYTNDDLYQMDKQLRAWFKRMRYRQELKHGFKTAVPLVFFHLFGRPSTKSDSATCRMLHTLLKYYCARYTGQSHIAGKKYNRVYHFNRFTAKNKRPYSLRLRVEEACEDGGNHQPFKSGPINQQLDKAPQREREELYRRSYRKYEPDEDLRLCDDSGGSEETDRMAEENR